MDKGRAIGQVEEEFGKLLKAVEGLDDKAMSRTFYGDWSVKDILAHIAGWHRSMTESMERMARGERPTPEGVDYSDADTWNAKFAQDALPGSAALNAFDAAFERYKAAAEAMPEALYGIDPEKNRPLIGNRLLQTAGIGHFEEHQPQLLEWLGRRNA